MRFRPAAFEEGREACLAVEERQGGEVFAVEIEKIEDEIDEAGAAAIGGLLHELEGGHAVRANAAELAVEIGGFDFQLRERVRRWRDTWRSSRARNG